MRKISLSPCPSNQWGEGTRREEKISFTKNLDEQPDYPNTFIERRSKSREVNAERKLDKHGAYLVSTMLSQLSPSRLSLKWSLLFAFTLLSVLPILLFSSWAQESMLSKKIDSLKHNQTLVAQNASVTLSQYLANASEGFANIADYAPSVANISHPLLITENITWIARANASGLDEPHSYTFSTFWGSEANKPQQGRLWLNSYINRAVNNPGKVIFSERVLDGRGLPFVYLIYANSEVPANVTFGALSLDYIESIRSQLNKGQSGYIAILDADGNVLAHPHFASAPSKVVEPGSSDHALQAHIRDLSMTFAGYDFFQSMQYGASGTSVYYSEPNHQEMLAAYSSVKLADGSRWGIMVSQPLIELKESTLAMREASWFVITIVIFFAVILSYLMTVFILKPFNFLAEMVGEYALDTKAGLTQFRKIDCTEYKSKIYFAELLNMTKVVKKMAADLSTYHENMEAKVAERSAVLEREVDQRMRVERQLRYVSSHDTLTGLPNAHLLEDRIDSAIMWSSATDTKIAVIIIKIFGIDEVQQRYSHIVGDSMMKSLSRKLENQLGKNDTLARTGAYEFTALLVHIGSIDAARMIAAGLYELGNDIRSYESRGLSEAPNVVVSASTGAAISCEKTVDAESLLDDAYNSFGVTQF